MLLWGLSAGLTYSAPELDSAEQFVWAFSMESGYWKHPPLPSWIMHALIDVFGPSVMLPFLATQACIVAALALTWRLGCEFMSPARALIAVALTSLVTYHNIGGDSFNHNTVLLPFQAATVLLFYLATRHNTWRLWALTGLFAGLSMLVKYVALMPLAGLLVYFASDRTLHGRRTLLGLLLAACVFGCVLVPHLLWLQRTDFLPFRYAREVTRDLPDASGTLRSLAEFLFAQILRLSQFLVGFWFVTRRGDAVLQSPTTREAPVMTRNDLLFLWVAALAPLTVTMLIGLLSASALQARWGTNAFLLSGLLVMALLRRSETPAMLRRTLRVVVAVHVLLCTGQTLSKTVVADYLERRTRANFPGAELARNALVTWQANTGVPLRLVVSDIWLGGNLIANRTQRLAVLIDGYHFKSPWVKMDAVERCGAMVLDDTTDDAAGRAIPSPALEALMDRADVRGTWNLPWSDAKHAATAGNRGVIRWGVIKPTSSKPCPLD